MALELANSVDAHDNNEVIIDFKYRIKDINGNYKWLHTYGTVFDRDERKKVEHVLNISHDISGQVEAEQKLAEQEHFIQHIADASPTILYLFDLEKQSIVYVNREISYALGYSSSEILNMQDKVRSILFHPDDQEKLFKSNKRLPSEALIQYECRMHEKDKGWKFMLIREIIFQEDAGGNPSKILCAALDISERKEMELQLKQKTFELEQSNTSLEEFAYVASHDLKEPLRKISSFGDRLLFKEKDNLKEDSKAYLDKIIDSSHRMQQMIDHLLQLSMISGEKTFEKYSLKNIVEEVLQTLEFKIEEKMAVIKVADLPTAKINPAQFRQLFQNLISNSLKFSRKDVPPVIEITCKYVHAGDIDKVQLSSPGRYLQLDLSDNGIGFDEKYSEKIFSIFQRLHGRSEYEGTGIGLAICKKIVENHSGKIYDTGKENEGAVFTIIIPA